MFVPFFTERSSRQWRRQKGGGASSGAGSSGAGKSSGSSSGGTNSGSGAGKSSGSNSGGTSSSSGAGKSSGSSSGSTSSSSGSGKSSGSSSGGTSSSNGAGKPSGSSSGSTSSSSGSGKSSGSSSGGTSKSGTGGSGTSGGSNNGGGTARANPISSGSRSGPTRSAFSYGNGGGKASTIPSGQPFSGRTEGGGSRSQVFGTRQYGSGYPGATGRGVAGRSFPFIFWPVVWGGIAGAGTDAYLHDESEYGQSDNSSRPGGVLMTVAFPSKALNETFRLLSDNATVTALLQDVTANCSSLLNGTDTLSPTAYTDSSQFPKPEQALQYYRASSVVLSLDDYNNTGALQADGTPDTALPNSIDTDLLNCLNDTIGAAVPLIENGSLGSSAPPTLGIVSLIYLIVTLSSAT